jgi:predicted ATP-dependent serine protease
MMAASKNGIELLERQELNKEQSLKSALSQLEKAFGKGAVMRMNEAAAERVEAIPTGSVSLDTALGIGGIPRGRITEIYGTESSGKTTIALQIIARPSARGAWRCLWTPNTPWTSNTPALWEWTWRSCTFRSLPQERKRWRSWMR